ncbi:MAG: hypothetical protein EOP07_24375 [Proteobacteria bacterium]|nr:MAG: hypothetical protein EOP07_24375 [Pseudomonadota bacterium]
MSRFVENILFVFTLTGLLACTPAGESERSKKAPASGNNGAQESAPKEKNDAESGNETESVSIPSNITGALLTCALRKEASVKDLETEIGCLLSDPVSGKKIAENPLLSFSSNDPIKVSSEAQPGASIYHVLYRIKGASQDEIRLAAQTAVAIVIYDSTKVKQEKIYNVLKPAIELDDYQAPIVRDQSIDADNPGSL